MGTTAYKYLTHRGVILSLLLYLFATVSAAAQKNMNVVFILADDLGWADTALYGQTTLYETLHLERLARKGMTFTRAYANSPLYSPTRASILTGQNPTRHGSAEPVHHTVNEVFKASALDRGPPDTKTGKVVSVSRLDTHLPTLGKLVNAAGYQTAHFGKWHLGHEPYSPLQHGFQLDIPHTPGPGPAGGYVAPWEYANFEPNHPKEHIEDRMAQEGQRPKNC